MCTRTGMQVCTHIHTHTHTHTHAVVMAMQSAPATVGSGNSTDAPRRGAAAAQVWEGWRDCAYTEQSAWNRLGPRQVRKTGASGNHLRVKKNQRVSRCEYTRRSVHI